jgi:MOSC domain-containing protein YiiM
VVRYAQAKQSAIGFFENSYNYALLKQYLLNPLSPSATVGIASRLSIICVTQPTERCKTIGRSLGVPTILKALHELELCGFYARVVRPGTVDVGDMVELCERSQVTWLIERLHQIMFRQLSDDQLVDQVLAIRELSTEWKKRLEVMRGRLRRGEPLSSNLA